MKSRHRGLSILEILIVCAILAVVVVTSVLLIGPGAKRNAYSARIKSDLRQCATAYQLYLNDYDDKLPLTRLSMSSYSYPKGPKDLEHSRGYFLPAVYDLQYDHWHRLVDERFKIQYKWSANTYTVIKEVFFVRKEGTYFPNLFSGPDNGWIRRTEPADRILGLAVTADGTCRWVDIVEQWEHEYAHYLGFVTGI